MRLIVLLSAAVLFLATAPLHAQHIGARLQWQPEIADTDPRLQQTVEIEILGIAAIRALGLLSDATGVSLTVAPEDLTTVGERELTIISKGLTLKAIMVQLPEALQECHWDIDASGEKPVHLLHRNGSLEATIAKRKNDFRRRHQAQYEAEQAAGRASLIEASRRALRMSPQQLDQLEQTDILLARAVQMPITREMMEAFLSLSDEDMAQFQATGELEFPYDDAPPGLRRLPQLIIDLYDLYLSWVESWPAGETHPVGGTVEEMRAEVDSEIRQFSEASDVTIALFGEIEGIRVDVANLSFPIMLHRNQELFPTLGGVRHFLLAQTGDDYATALATAEKWTQERQQAIEQDAIHEWEEHLGPEPTDPRLLQSISLPGVQDRATLLDIQQTIATQTGISLLSDSFSRARRTMLQREALPAEVPLWHILAYLTHRHVEWSLAGDCLVFHHERWYNYSRLEAAEERGAAAVHEPTQ